MKKIREVAWTSLLPSTSSLPRETRTTPSSLPLSSEKPGPLCPPFSALSMTKGKRGLNYWASLHYALSPTAKQRERRIGPRKAAVLCHLRPFITLASSGPRPPYRVGPPPLLPPLLRSLSSPPIPSPPLQTVQ